MPELSNKDTTNTVPFREEIWSAEIPPPTCTNTHPSQKSLTPPKHGSQVHPSAPRTPQGGRRVHALQLPVSPGLRSVSLQTDLRVGQDFQSFMTIYLSLQVSGGTQPDPQPLSQLLICLYGFILCVKTARNSITVRVTKLSPECHKWFSLLMAASRGNTVTLPRFSHPSPVLAWLGTSSCRES